MAIGTLIVKTAPAKELVSAEEAREFLRVDSTEESAEVLRMIRAATALAEHQCARSLITRTYELYVDAFACVMPLRRPPVASVTALEYLDDALAWQPVAGSVYRLVQHGLAPAIVLLPNQAWPTTVADVPQCVRITYVAGYGAEGEAVPEPIRSWVKALVGSMHEHREADAERALQRLGFIDGLLDPYRIHEVA